MSRTSPDRPHGIEQRRGPQPGPRSPRSSVDHYCPAGGGNDPRSGKKPVNPGMLAGAAGVRHPDADEVPRDHGPRGRADPGPAGWGEFSPFAEYGPAESARWLASAIESAAGSVARAGQGHGPGERDRARGRARARDADRRRLGLPDGEGQGGRAGAGARPRTSSGSRRSATRSTRPSGGRIRVDANGGWQAGQAVRMLRRLAAVRARVRRAALRHAGGARRAAPGRRHSDRGRRVDPQGRGPAAGPGGGRGRHRHGEGAAARRRAGRAAGGRGLRAAGRGVQRGRHLGRAGRRRRAGRRAARAARTPAAWPRCRCWPAT